MTPKPGSIPLDEEVWRKWLHKGRLREQARDRQGRVVAGIVVALLVIAFALVRLVG